jgi:hypothetical protein
MAEPETCTQVFPYSDDISSVTPDVSQFGLLARWGRLESMSTDAPDEILCGDEITIGRNPDCSIIITHPSVSGLHCRIERSGKDNVYLEDKSSNGTFIDKSKIRVGKDTKVLIHHGKL